MIRFHHRKTTPAEDQTSHVEYSSIRLNLIKVAFNYATNNKASIPINFLLRRLRNP